MSHDSICYTGQYWVRFYWLLAQHPLKNLSGFTTELAAIERGVEPNQMRMWKFWGRWENFMTVQRSGLGLATCPFIKSTTCNVYMYLPTVCMHVMYICTYQYCIYELWLYDYKVCTKRVTHTKMNDYHLFNLIEEVYLKATLKNSQENKTIFEFEITWN